jgi:hypothetical protein
VDAFHLVLAMGVLSTYLSALIVVIPAVIFLVIARR